MGHDRDEAAEIISSVDFGGNVALSRSPQRLRHIIFTLPDHPPSVNQIYELGSSINSPHPQLRIKSEWLIWRSAMKPYVPACPWAKDCYLKLWLDFVAPTWNYKNGKLKRIDLPNLEKFAIDTIFQKIECDDSRIVEKVSRKRIGERVEVQVAIEEVGWDCT